MVLSWTLAGVRKRAVITGGFVLAGLLRDTRRPIFSAPAPGRKKGRELGGECERSNRGYYLTITRPVILIVGLAAARGELTSEGKLTSIFYQTS